MSREGQMLMTPNSSAPVLEVNGVRNLLAAAEPPKHFNRGQRRSIIVQKNAMPQHFQAL